MYNIYLNCREKRERERAHRTAMREIDIHTPT